ncbi:Alpha/Beta hydrolase protein [Fusarium flagelliforme]|uniref:Epoxide hydrolase 1 n=1 Tax=Fusarium flagelliforme TaxID=2675880 RepID=A0A395N5A2_9HYPO|nr:Alpha/Beta hydrolase protein [Fusarium flagelliforme]KAH7198320.1 Alpha/Beta hydrolase protein [Fusarium flagelliforme]RFN55281.1 epoxide hydrolase 1 [Fusarium flagelliforme]
MADDIKPYRIKVPESDIQLLKDKLESARFPAEDEVSDDWTYGAGLNDVKRLAAYWKDEFDWRAQEAKLNQYPQFTTNVSVDGFGDLEIHFLHQRSSKANSIPLLFFHGWPGSFAEVFKLLPLLTEPKDGPSFHVVAPSLPNHCFSDGVSKRGFGIPRYGETMHKLMLKLGYDKYVTQGGDWGYIITRMIGAQYPEHCLASHMNMIPAVSPPNPLKTPWQFLRFWLFPFTAQERKGIEQMKNFFNEGLAYNLIMSTKPSTIGFGLADSPVALLAWIYEKLHDWTDDYKWTDDEILMWVSLYQFSKAGPAASARIYYESRHADQELTKKVNDWIPGVLLGLSYFPKDIVFVPKTWGRTLGPVVFERIHTSGGHFASIERPEELVEDVREMFGKSVSPQILEKLRKSGAVHNGPRADDKS